MCRRRSSLSLWTSWRCSPLFLILDKKRISAPRLKRRLPSFSRPPFLLSHSLPFPLLHSPGRGRGRRSSASLCALDFQQSATSGACASASRAAAHRRRTQIARAAAWLCSLSLYRQARQLGLRPLCSEPFFAPHRFAERRAKIFPSWTSLPARRPTISIIRSERDGTRFIRFAE